MPSNSVAIFNKFLEEAKINDTEALNKTHYVTGLAAKWAPLKTVLISYETAKKTVPETAVVRNMITQLKVQMQDYAKRWPKEFEMAGGV